MGGNLALRVGACLAAGSPPGTGQAPLNASGSTSDAAERHIVQRGSGVVALVPGVQRAVRPREHQAQVTPVVVTTDLRGNDVVDLHLRYVRNRQPGYRAPVLLPSHQVPAEAVAVGDQSAKEGSFPPLLP